MALLTFKRSKNFFNSLSLYARHTKNWIKPQSSPQDTEAESLARSLSALCALCGYVFSIHILLCPSYSPLFASRMTCRAASA
jgi:hypothetical protein